MKIVGIIPARGGSKGIKNKNIMDLNGKPLIGYTIESALEAKLLDKVVISTDCPLIKENVLHRYKVEVIDRPAQYAKDDSPIEEALLHAVEHLKKTQNYNADIVVWLQANVPFRPQGLIDEVVQRLVEADDADSCVTCYEVEQRPELMKVANKKNRLQPLESDVYAIRRQEFSNHYLLDGSVIVVRAKNLYETIGIRKAHVYLCKEIIPVVQKEKIYTLEIDTPDDILLANFYLEKLTKQRTDRKYNEILQ
ncbi:MAG TPA: acylneuraminate cytidylyltransferase family protein [Candidatus Omnitrophota bacterium]|nr:acylneuraminate cytidylyltransferase family protein [Candidatus Omnitrophota bacterium]